MFISQNASKYIRNLMKFLTGSQTIRSFKCINSMYEIKQTEPAMFAVKIQPNSSHCGIHLSAIELPDHCAVLGLLRKNCIIPVSKDPEIYAGDSILAIALHPMLVPALKVVLKKTHSVYYSLNDCLLASKSDSSHSFNGFCSSEATNSINS